MKNKYEVLDETVKIYLRNGYYCTIDKEDIDKIKGIHWLLNIQNGNNVYVQCNVSGKRHMHRVIMELEDPNLQIDHINGNGLDNRKSNLRICTKEQNAKNIRFNKRNTSGFKGVHYRKDTNNWQARIKASSKNISLGSYLTSEEAAKAYDRAALQYHGEFANTNFPKEDYL